MERRVAPSCLRVRQPRTVYADDDPGLHRKRESLAAKSWDLLRSHSSSSSRDGGLAGGRPRFYSKFGRPSSRLHKRHTPAGVIRLEGPREGSQTRAWGRAHSHGGHS